MSASCRGAHLLSAHANWSPRFPINWLPIFLLPLLFVAANDARELELAAMI